MVVAKPVSETSAVAKASVAAGAHVVDDLEHGAAFVLATSASGEVNFRTVTGVV